MKHPILPWRALAILLAASCAGPAITAEQQEQLTRAERQLKVDPDAALALTDQLLETRPEWREARILSAEGNLALSRQGRRNTRELLVDAANNYEKALKQKSEDPAAWIGLAEARYGLAEYEGACTAALEACKQLDKKGANQEQLKQAGSFAARSQYEVFLARRQEELRTKAPEQNGFVKPEQGTADAAQQAIILAQQLKRTDPGEGFALSAKVLLWLNQHNDARNELENGIRAAPSSAELHTAYQDLYRGMGDFRAMAAAYARFVREQPGQLALLWYQGRAFVVQADDQRHKGAPQPAIDLYTKALDCFARYRAMQPADGSANEWRAICELSMARLCNNLGDSATARSHLFAAIEASPKTLAYDGNKPQLTDSFGAHFTSNVSAISQSLRESGPDGLRKALAFSQEVLRRHDKSGEVYSDAALTARDLGVGVAAKAEQAGIGASERAGYLTEAMRLWEQSFAWYQEAVRLSPEDARITNDCALMLVYHLHRDFDQARKLFDRAIELGERQLAALPAEATKEHRQFLEEAVGDAWQNIAVMQLQELKRPWSEAKPFCEKSVKYYPYQEREAAAMLRNEGRLQPQDPQAGDKAKAFAKVQQAVDASVKEGDLDAALATMDAAAKELKDHAAFCALRGEVTLRYAMARRDEGQTRGLELLFRDALAMLQRAVELDGSPPGPRLSLAQAQFETGATAEAAATASKLLLHLQSQGGGKPAELSATHRVRGRAAAMVYTTAKGEGRDRPELLADLRTSFRYLEQQKQLDAQLGGLWAVSEQWAGNAAEAVNILVRALKQQPDSEALLNSMTETARAADQSALAVEALNKRTDAMGLWFLGKARFWAAHDLYTGGKHAEAQTMLEQAQAAFTRSLAGNAAFADSCRQWQAMVLGKKGCIAYAAEKYDDAEKWLVESARLCPDRIAEKLGGADNVARGILLVAEHFRVKGDIDHVIRIYRQAITDYADVAWLDILNNLGLFARDHGTTLERGGRKDDAMKLYEESYAAYSKAQPLDPTNVRLRNDRALMLIYHLHRDWDLAKELLEAAIADGDKQLKDDPPAHAQARQDLDEAVGDCYENLALWHLTRSKDAAAAKAAATKSLDHYPGRTRGGARRHLQAAEALGQKGD